MPQTRSGSGKKIFTLLESTMRFLFFSLLSLLCIDLAEAATLSGFILDGSDGEKLPNATILVEGQQLGTLSNSEGYYAIRNIPAGNQVIVASYIGYETYRDTLSFAADRDLRLDLELTRETLLIDEEVVVTADRTEDELRQQASVIALQARSLERMPAVGEPDLLRSLQLLPGVQSASDISSGLYVRGGGPDQTRILLDQIPLYNPSHAFGLFSTFNPDAIKDVTFYKGAYPAPYGGSLGAVLDVQNREGNRRDFGTRGGISLISSRLTTEGPLGNGSWMIAGRRTYIDPVLRVVQSKTETLDNLGYYFYDLNAKLNNQPTESDNLTFSAYLGRDRLNINIGDETETFFDIDWGNRALTSRWTHIFSPEFFGRLIAQYSEYQSDISLSIFDTPIAIRNRVRDLSLKADIDYFASANHTLRSGLSLTRFRFDYGFEFNQEFTNLRVTPLLASLYAQDDWQLTPLTEARLGLRGTYYDEGQRLSLDPRFSLSRVLGSGWRWKLAGGRYRQYLQLVSTEGFQGGDAWVPLDETVEPGRSWQAVTGFEWQPSPAYRLSAETYFTDLANLVLLDEDRSVDREQETSEEVFKTGGTGIARGLELFFEKRSGRLRGWLGYTLGWTERTFAEVDQGRWFPPKYDRRHDISLTGSYRIKRWRFTANFIYATGQAFTPAAARYSLRDPATGLLSDRVLGARRNTARLSPYHRLDLGVRRTLTFFGSEVETYLQIFNAYNRRNDWFVQYDTDDPETKPEIVRMLPVIPTFGFNFKF